MRLAYRAHFAWSFQCGPPNFVTFNLGSISTYSIDLICLAFVLNGSRCQHNWRTFRAEMETGRVDRPVGSRFFDRPVKPVEKPVKFSFLATKRHLSTNRNILIYFIINKTFCKKTVLTNHIFRKHLLNSFKQ